MNMNMCWNKLLYTSCICIISLFWGCKNPFFVHTGIQQVESNRKTPEDAIKKHLKNTYNYRNIRLFEELLCSEDEFRFYVVNDQGYVDSNLQHINKNQFEKVTIDKNVDFFVADDSIYIYLTYSEEVNLHRNMFNKTEDIVCGIFDPYRIDYFDTAITIGDSTYYDTLEAIVYLNETDITMTSDIFIPIYGNRQVKFMVAKQVFFMKKDNKDLWRIRLWFELGRKRSA